MTLFANRTRIDGPAGVALFVRRLPGAAVRYQVCGVEFAGEELADEAHLCGRTFGAASLRRWQRGEWDAGALWAQREE